MIAVRRSLALVLWLGCSAGCKTSTDATISTAASVDASAAAASSTTAAPDSGLEPASAAAPIESAPTSTSASSSSSSKPATRRSLDEMLLFFPAKFPEGNWQPVALKFEDASFQAVDGTRLHGWYCPCENPRAVVLFLHGNAGNISHRIDRLRSLQNEFRVTTLAFDYRGYGKSQGTPTTEGVIADARAARKFLAERAGVAESQVVLLGESLGGAVAVSLAGADGCRGLALENTFSSLADVAAHHYPRLAWLVPADKLNSVKSIARYPGPILQCHGDADRTIPFASGEKLFAAAPGPKQFVRNAKLDHNDPLSAEYFRRLDQFLTDLPK